MADPGFPRRRRAPTIEFGANAQFLPKTAWKQQSIPVGCVSPALHRRGGSVHGVSPTETPRTEIPRTETPRTETPQTETPWTDPPPGTRDQRLCLRVVIKEIGPLDPPMLLDRIYLLPLT